MERRVYEIFAAQAVCSTITEIQLQKIKEENHAGGSNAENDCPSSMGIGELIGLGMETMIVSFAMKIMSVLITVILYGRMIEIYLYVSVAPIPAATVTNREWGSVGTNYLKGLIALAFQGFFIMVCVAIYAVLVAGVAVAGNLHSALWSVAAYTVILCFSLFKTGSLSKSIFNAH